MEAQKKESPNAMSSEETSLSPHMGRRRIKSSFLFQARREVVIVHETEEYTLRITRNGKLILTK